MLRRIRGLDLGEFGTFADEGVNFGGGGSAHDLHVVVGDSGTGKTTLCHALRLVLYGTTRSVSAATVSIPAHESAEGPATATVSAELDATDGRCRAERMGTAGPGASRRCRGCRSGDR
jgi:DNA repair exonuclease SbcCD ATPase subunit